MKRLINLLILIFVILVGGILPAFAINIPVTNPPINPVITYDNYIYVADATAPIPVIKIYNTVSSINTPVAAISGEGGPAGMVLSPDGTKLYVAFNNSVKMFGKTGNLLATATGNYYGNKQIAVSSDNKHLFVVDSSAENVKVINIGSDGRLLYNKSISIPGAANLYGIAVSPDNSLLAVSRRNANDSVYIYTINYNASGNVSGLTAKKTLPSLPYPSHVLFSNDSEYLYVRVDDATTFVDAKVYKVSDNFATPENIILHRENAVATNEQDSNNLHGESMALSSNGEVLYLTHYVSSSTVSSENNKIHAYSMRTKVVELNASGEAVWVPRSNWTFGFASNGQTYDSEFKKNLGASKDGMVAAPDGSRIWFSCSNGGGFTFSKYTGFTNSNGDLINPVPQAPVIVHPSAGSGDDLLNYSGIAQWSGQAGSKFDVYYKEVGANSWKLLEGYTSNTYASLVGKLIPGHTYVIRAKAFVSSVWSSYAYSRQFKMANPKITGIENQRNAAIDSAAIFQFIRIKGRGFGDKDVFDANFDEQINFRSADGTDNIIPIKEGNDRRITAWADDHIDMVIPLKFGVSVGPNGKERGRKVVPGDYKIIVTAYGVDTPAFAFGVDPVINNMTPVEGVPGQPIDIYGQGFGTNTSEVWIALGGEKTKPEKVEEDHVVFKVPSGLSTNTPLPLKVFANNRFTPSVYGRGNWNEDVLFTALTPQPPEVATIQVQSVDGGAWETKDWGYIYNSVRLISSTGHGFGGVKGTVKYGSITIPSDDASLSWSDNIISFNVRRSYGGSYIEAGTQTIEVATAGGSATKLFTIRPSITISPISGPPSKPNVRISGFALGPSGSNITINFGGTDITTQAAVARDSFTDDSVLFTIPSDATIGTKEVYVKAASQESNRVSFEVTSIATPEISTIEVQTSEGSSWVEKDWGYIYNTIRLIPSAGHEFGLSGEVQVGTYTVPSNLVTWSENAITFYIPRKIDTNYLSAGSADITIVSRGGRSTKTFFINPNIKITPSEGIAGKKDVRIGGFGYGAVGSTVPIDFGGTIINARVNRDEAGDDYLKFDVPTTATQGDKDVSITINSRRSNVEKFTVLPPGTPVISTITPNAAPNSLDNITVVISGTNFQNGTTVELKQAAETINGTVRFDALDKLTVTFAIKNKPIGKWDVVAINLDGTTDTAEKAFTILDGTLTGSVVSQVIDDFEGIIVKADGYTPIDMNFSIVQTDKYEGDNAAAITYGSSLQGFRSYTASLSQAQDLSKFKKLVFMLKLEGVNQNAQARKMYLQVMAMDSNGITRSFSIPEASYIDLNQTIASYAKQSFLTQDLIEVDDHGQPKAGGVSFDSCKANVVGYMFGFQGNDAYANPIRIDFVAGEDYNASVVNPTGPVTTTIARVADAVDSAVTISWTFTDPANAGPVDIYTVSGAWDAADGVFSQDRSRWPTTPEFSAVAANSINDNVQVGKGTQKYYKVIPAGTALTSDMLATDIVGKFDVAVGPSDTQPERVLISIPLETTSTALSSIFGSQPSENDSIATIDNNFSITAGCNYVSSSWQIIDASIPAITDIMPGYSFVYTTLNSKYLTVVGKVRESAATRVIAGGWDAESDTAKLSWVSSAYPIPLDVKVDTTGLNGLSFGDSAITGAQIVFMDANAAIINDIAGNPIYALHTAAAMWSDTNNAPASLKLMPGRGYLLTEPIINSYNWSQSRSTGGN